MSQFPPQPPGQDWAQQPAAYGYAAPKTSGMAIASLVCGIISLVACCTMVPSILGITFGAVAMPPIRRGEQGGRGLAISGITLSVIGLAIGVAVWVVAVQMPEAAVVKGGALSDEQRKTLESLGAVEPGETIRLFYATGFFSIKEGGVVLTDNRLVVYQRDGTTSTAPLSEIQDIDFTPGETWFDNGTFVVQREDGELIDFTIGAVEPGDRHFHGVLRRMVNQARQAAGKSPLPGGPGDDNDD